MAILDKHAGFWMDDNKASYDKRSKNLRRESKYLTFEALEDECQISMIKIGNPNAVNMKYSLDDGFTWISYTLGTKITINQGQTIKFLNATSYLSSNNGSYYQFIIPNKMDVYGDISSLRNFNTGLGNYVFYRLFYNTNIVRAEEMKIPFKSLVNYCYYRMFESCKSLVSAPELPATTLSAYCYYEMFLNCTSLTQPPLLPTPKFTVTYAYYRMFYGCSALDHITIYCINTYGYDSCFTQWLTGCASTGTIYKPSSLNFPSSYIPSGWTVESIQSETITFWSVNEVHRLSNFTGTATFSSYNKPTFLKIDSNGDVSIKGNFNKFSEVFYLAIKRDDQPTEHRIVEFLYLDNCLKFTAAQANSSIGFGANVKWNVNNTFFYSMDDGLHWTEYVSPSNTDYATCQMISLPNVGDSVIFRGTTHLFSANANNYMKFRMTGKISVSGNIFSLIGFYSGTIPTYSFYHLFEDCSSLLNVPELASTVANSYCYRGMFMNCTSLTEVSILPATDIYAYCYAEMFMGCTSLVKAPVLPSTNIREGSYYSMFEGCTALTEAPVLPGTTVTTNSYYRMFADCTALTNAHSAIHATSINGSYAFKEMFLGCTSLEKAPRILATSLGAGYCERMFYGCSSLNWVAISVRTWREGATTDWLEGTSPTGFFRCSSLFLPIIRGSSYIPSGWDVSIVNTTSSIEADYIDNLTLSSYFPVAAENIGDDVINKITLSCNNLPSGLTLNNGVLTGAITEDKDFTITASTSANSWEVPVHLHKITYADALKFTATQANSKIRLIKAGSPPAITCFYSLDNGSTWVSYSVTSSSATITLPNIGDTIMFRCTSSTFATSTSYYYRFYLDAGGFKVSGHLSSLCNFNDACVSTYQFFYLFYNCTRLYEATIKLHSALTNYCYYDLFIYCYNLTVVPELPCMNVRPYCYFQMFAGCTSLVNVPVLPAVFLTEGCYRGMFSGCTSLVTPPVLNSTVISSYTYYQMFDGCTSLATAPELPCTYVLAYSYYRMFYNCTSLTTAPKLSAMRMDSYCYAYMFLGCTSLVNVPDLPTVIYAASHRGMFYGCESLTQIRTMMYSNSFNQSNTQVFISGCANNGKLVLLNPTATPVFDDFYGVPSNWYCTDANGKTLGIGASATAEIGLLPGETINYQLTHGRPTSDTVTFEAIDAPEGITVSSSGLITGNCATDEAFFIDVKLNGELQKKTRVFINHATINDCLKFTNVNTTSSRIRIVRALMCRPIRLQYSLDDGTTWESFVFNTYITVPKDSYILVRNLDDFFASNYDIGFQFGMDGKFEVSGSIASLTNFSRNIEHECEYTRLFSGCSQLMSVENLILPYETLKYYCYMYMFNSCTNITTPPVLPSMKMDTGCYEGMFYSCTKLTRTPNLPATVLASACYQNMFYNCQKLTEVSTLPALEMQTYCYRQMFYNCTSLTNAPALPATVMKSYCYGGMFYNCTSLEEPPDIPATELATYCFQDMFRGCKKLTRMPQLHATVMQNYCYYRMFYECTALTETTWMHEENPAYCHQYMFTGCSNLSLIRCNLKTLNRNHNVEWVKGVAQNGVYVKNPKLENTFGLHSIPVGWTVKNAVVVGNNNFTQMIGVPSITLDCTCDSSELSFSSDDIPSALALSSGGEITNDFAVENEKYSFHVTATPTDTDISPITFPVYVSYRSDILKFTALQDGSSIGFGVYSSTFTCDNHFFYSLNNGITWTEYVNPSSKKYTACEMINVPNGGSILFRGITNNFGYADSYCFQFRMTGQFDVSGNIMSLINFADEIPSEWCFARLFYLCSSLVTAHNLILPATKLMARCYQSMFHSSGITTCPQLPATELADYCYYAMFNNCTSLEASIELPATKLQTYSYQNMFYGDNKLTGITVYFNSWTAVSTATSNWVYGISNNTGTFTIKSATLPIERGANRIPTNWTVVREP